MPPTRRASVAASVVQTATVSAGSPVLAGRVRAAPTGGFAVPVVATTTVAAAVVTPQPASMVAAPALATTTATATTHLATAVPLPELPLPPMPELPLPNGMSMPMPDSPPEGGEEASGPAERRVWTADEDEQIAALVAEHGTRSWSVIAARLPTRTGKQCRERWHNHLDPGINKSEWTPDEDKKLLEAHETMGNKWAEIAKFLPGRTDNQIKNRWNSALRRELRKLNRLANKQKGAVAAAMAAATAAAAAVGGASDTGSGNGMSDAAAIAAAREPLGAVLKELTNPSNPASTGGSPRAANAANAHTTASSSSTNNHLAAPAELASVDTGAEAAGAELGDAASPPGSGHKPTRPCKKKASLQMTATALQAATEAQETLLDSSCPLPHGVTEEDQANAKILLQHMHELNTAWAAIDAESDGDTSTAEPRKMSKLHEHMDWLQSFCTTLVEKSLLRRNEPKPEKEAPKRRRGKNPAAAGSSSKQDAAAGAEGDEEGASPAKPPKRTRKKNGSGGRKGKKNVGEEDEEDAEEKPKEEGELSVTELLEMAGATRGLNVLSNGGNAGSVGTSPRGPNGQPLLTLPPHLASQLASPLAIYDSDFAPGSGCLSSPRHFLSPRTVEQLHSEGGLSSGDLRLSGGSHNSARGARDEGEEAAAACLSARMQVTTTTAASTVPVAPPSAPPAAAATTSAAAATSTAAAVSASSGGGSGVEVAAAAGDGDGAAATSAAGGGGGGLLSVGPRSAAAVAAAVYEAIGGLATLAAAAPGGKRARSDDGAHGDDEAEPGECGYEGAGVSERRKPAGLCNLQLPNANGGGPRPSPKALPVSAASSGTGSSLGSAAGLASFSNSTAGDGNGGCASAGAAAAAGPSSGGGGGGGAAAAGPSGSSMPGTARSVELAALVSPAFGALGVRNPLSAIGASPYVSLAVPGAPSPTNPPERARPHPINATGKACVSPKRLRGENSPLASPPADAPPATVIAC